MDNPEDVATYSLRQIAQKTKLAPPTFSRLARAVGLEEYESLKDICRSELKRNSLSLAQRAAALQDEHLKLAAGDRGSFATSHAITSVDNINTLLENLDTDQLADIADKLAQSSKVYLLGALSSRAILEYFHHMVCLATSGWKMIRPENHAVPMIIEEADENAVVLVVSIEPYIRRTIEIAELMEKKGATIISITDDIASPVLRYSKHSFFVPAASRQFFPSYVGVLTLLEILMGMLIRRWGDKAKKRIDSVERLSHAIGDYMK